MKQIQKYIIYSLIAGFCLFAGFIFFLIQKDWLIIQFTPFFNKKEILLDQKNSNVVLKRRINFYYFKDNKLLREESNFIWFSNRSENLKHLINNWLSFLHGERIMERKVSAEVISGPVLDQVAYLSFDQSPFSREWSVYKKWNFVESLLKTIKEASLNIKHVVFLVAHQQMEDDHIDFSQYWPIEGFK